VWNYTTVKMHGLSAFNLGFVKHKVGLYLQHGDGLIYVTVPHV